MKRLISALLSAAAVSALAVSPALAFDKVDWDWKTHIDTYVDIDADIQLDVKITGMVQVEKLQIFLGDVSAESTVKHIYNTPFYPTSGERKPCDGYDSKCEGDKGHDASYAVDDTHYYYRDAKSSYRDTEHELKLHDRGGQPDFDKVDVKPLDATTQLPIVLSSAQAIGNNQSITSDVPIFVHDGQFVANVPAECDYCQAWKSPGDVQSAGLMGGGGGGSDHGGNTNTDLAILFGLGAISHVLTPADISAESTVYDIHNASVDSSATALANNVSITLLSGHAADGKDTKSSECKDKCDHNTDPTGNHIVIADITQFALANVEAESSVHDVTATGYSNMRQLTTATLQTVDGVANTPVAVPTPWVSSVATAVGNNASITVGTIPTNFTPKK